MSIQWFPGHMHKATKEIKEVLPKVDVIIEVLDARIPYSSENPVIGNLRGEKPSIKLLNKADLADAAITDDWIRYLEMERGVKAQAVSQQAPDRIRQLTDLVKKLVPHKADAVGNINALIMGIPNVGKSTIINTLAGKTIAKTGNEPAVTKGQQKINLHNGIMLWDTPGILWPKVENEKSSYRLATTGAIKDTAISHDDVAFFAAEYLLRAYPERLAERYQLDPVPTTELDLLEAVGRKRGCLVGGGRVDLDKVSKLFLTELRDGTLGALTFETPVMAAHEKVEVEALIARKEEEMAAKKAARKKKFKKRR
ncbi:Ribosome biogenesis GTPase A [BD1-7 clade bacterium]|uniref:Ribosome biogenesis GTPase A n=1 Tax=BD1-7 clade bacterium TaxID=2029982 RepID=A0A5S9P6V2_9GAMM|nr:Ribosome biogenesis GTPase A [BD1-7 clade bacterium]